MACESLGFVSICVVVSHMIFFLSVPAINSRYPEAVPPLLQVLQTCTLSLQAINPPGLQQHGQGLLCQHICRSL
jgi:hypothetical protein